MANQKFSELDEVTTLDDEDIFPLVHDGAGAKITVENLRSELGADGGSSPVLKAVVPLSAAEFISVTAGTPLEAIEAPGVGLAIVPHKLSAAFLAGTVAYDNDFDQNANLMLDWDGQSLGLISVGVTSWDTVDPAASFTFGSSSDESPLDLSDAENKALVLRGENAQTGGNGTAILTIVYSLATVAP